MTELTLNSTAASLLGFLADGPMSGWDLAAGAERLIGDFWTLTRSQVYRELSALADAGFVKAGEPGPRERRAYSLTKAGRAAFKKWVNREPGRETIRFPLLVTIGFGRHLSAEKLAAFVANHRRTHAETLRRYETVCEDVIAGGAADAYGFATLSFGIAYERAVLSWFDALPETIRGKASDGHRGRNTEGSASRGTDVADAIFLDPDIATQFRNSREVNDALRELLKFRKMGG